MSRILIIEDDASIGQMYRFKLEKLGYTVRHAFNGEEGLKLAQEFNPVLILLDLHMPIMNGDEMLKKLRTQKWGSDIRVIILTNFNRNEVPPSLQLLNVDRYVVKAHSTPSQVTSMVTELIGKSV